MKRSFTVKAIWDEEAQAFYSESDIVGLHIEAATLAEFQEVMHECAFDLVVANHMDPAELATSRIADLIPTIFWDKSGAVAA